MARKGKDFELLISKFESLKNTGANIKSPDYVYDSDVKSKREVDIGIRFEDNPIYIAVECRDRGSVQDIQWIEQLITKKKSINADVLIAVTASSFTKPAKMKAFKNGIIIRCVENINANDIIAIKKTNYLEVCYISNLIYTFDSISLYDSDTETNQHLELMHLQHCFIHNKETDEKIPFVSFINDSVVDGSLKIENLDKRKNINGQLKLKHSNLSLWPFNYDVQAVIVSINANIEKIKYPLVSVKEYKDSITYDLLAQIQEYGPENNSFIIDKPSNTSNWQIDWNALQKPDKIISSLVVYNENPTKLQKVTIKT